MIRLKDAIIAIVLALGPVLYMLGTFGGKRTAKLDKYKHDADQSEKLAKFQTRMSKHDAQIGAFRSRDPLIERLRRDGL
jgi:hypothetical protein